MKTMYLFVCNYNAIVFIWAVIGTICAQRSEYRSTVQSHGATIKGFPVELGTSEDCTLLSFLERHWAGTLRSFALSTVWVFVVALSFSISSQRQPASIHEDQVNNPWRPLPSQRITPSQATTLLAVVSTLGLFLSSILGGSGPYLIQLAASYHYNDLGGAHGHHIVRDVLNAIGMTSWLYGCIDVAGGPPFQFSSSELALSLTLIAAVTTTIANQDFRDIDGDIECGHSTLPIAIGNGNARVILATSILLWWFGIAIIWETRLLSAMTGMGMLIAVRLLILRNRSADKITMKLWYGWFATLPLTLL